MLLFSLENFPREGLKQRKWLCVYNHESKYYGHNRLHSIHEFQNETIVQVVHEIGTVDTYSLYYLLKLSKGYLLIYQTLFKMYTFSQISREIRVLLSELNRRKVFCFYFLFFHEKLWSETDLISLCCLFGVVFIDVDMYVVFMSSLSILFMLCWCIR